MILQSHPRLPETRSRIAVIRIQILNHLRQSIKRALHGAGRCRRRLQRRRSGFSQTQHVLLPRGNKALEQEQVVGVQPELGENPSEPGVPASRGGGTEEFPHSGIGVDHPELVVESGAAGELVTEDAEPGDFAAEVEARRRRRQLQGLGGDARDAAT